MSGKFEVEKSNDDKYFFRLRSSGGTILLFSETFTTKASAKDSITSVQSNATNNERYERATSSDKRYYFTLKARNGEKIGLSLLHDTELARNLAIESTKQDAPAAEVVDLA